MVVEEEEDDDDCVIGVVEQFWGDEEIDVESELVGNGINLEGNDLSSFPFSDGENFC